MHAARSFASLSLLTALAGACAPPVAPAAGVAAHTPPTPSTAPLAHATSAPLFTEDELGTRLTALTETRNHRLGLVQSPVLIDDGHTALYLAAGPRDPKLALYTYDVAQRTASVLASASTLAGDDSALPEAERKRRERMRVTTRGISSFEVSADGARVLVTFGGKLFVMERAAHTTTPLELPAGVVDAHFSPSGKFIGFVRDNNVWVYSLATRRERAITRGGTDEKSYGLAEFVAQEELDRTRGFWFAPDDSEILVQYTDNAGVEKLITADPATPEAGGEPRFYPRAGKANATIGFFRYDLRENTAKRLALDLDLGHFPYIASVVWPKEGPLTFVALNRAQTELEAWALKPHAIRAARLLHESDPAWLHTNHTTPTFFDHGTKFLWASDAKGSPRLSVREVVDQVDHDALASVERNVLIPYAEYTRSFAFFDTRERFAVLLDHDSSGHTGVVHMAHDQSSSFGFARTYPSVLELRRPENGSAYLSLEVSNAGPPAWHIREAQLNQQSAHALLDLGQLPNQVEAPLVPTNAERITTPTRHYSAVILRPTRVRPGSKLPLIDAIYGGPGVNTVTENLWSYARNQWLADATGAAVVVLDVEGTPGRGRDFERASYKQFGSMPLGKHLEALRDIAYQHADLDPRRFAIVGWSFGGYLAARAALEYPNFFMAAVAGAPPVDWRDYDTCYTERYLGLPGLRVPSDPAVADNDVYSQESLLLLAGKRAASSPLLIFHGTRDDNVYFAQSLKLADALFRANKPFEFVPLKNTTHLLYEPLLTAAVWQKTANFLRNGLAGESHAPE